MTSGHGHGLEPTELIMVVKSDAVGEIAAVLNVARSTIVYWIRDGRI